MLSFLLQWPTLLTLVMFPILVTMCVRLARREEREALAEFGDASLGVVGLPVFAQIWRVADVEH